MKLEESERNRRNVQGELNAVLESKDDAGKSVCVYYTHMSHNSAQLEIQHYTYFFNVPAYNNCSTFTIDFTICTRLLIWRKPSACLKPS